MEYWLTQVSPSITAVVVIAAMLAAWVGGYAWGRRHHVDGVEANGTKLGDATLALLGLLLAFTFSMSLDRHENRRAMAVTDANAIGDFATCASLVAEPIRGRLRKEVREYLEARLSLAATNYDEEKFRQFLSEVDASHDRVTKLVQEAVDGGTPVVVPLVNTLNGLTSSHASRLSAVRDRLPASVVALLVSVAVFALLLTGRQQGQSGEWRPDATLVFTVLVGLVIWVILDLNEPQRGLIVVSQEPLQRLAETLAH